MKRIKRVGVWQTSKVVSLVYFIVIAIIIIPIALLISLLSSFFGNPLPYSGVLFLIVPFFYGIIFFILTLLGCVVYNIIAKATGGIEFDVELVDEEDHPM